MTEQDIKDSMTLKNCKKLKELILNNPDLPLLIFVNGELCFDEIGYYSCDEMSVGIKELTIYESPRYDNPLWLSKEEYKERLAGDMEYDEKYDNLPPDAFNLVFKEKVANTPFVKAICLYVGD